MKTLLAQSIPLGLRTGDKRSPDPFKIWRQGIRQARRSIDIEQFYLSSIEGSCTDAIINDILQAAARGVLVRILIDKSFWIHNSQSGDTSYLRPINILSANDNIKIKYSDEYNKQGGVLHAKFMLIDDNFGWLGSQNFDWRSLDHIIEVGARLTDRDYVGKLKNIFLEDWFGVSKNITQDESLLIHHNQLLDMQLGRRIETGIVNSPLGQMNGEMDGDLIQLLRGFAGASRCVSIMLRRYVDTFRKAPEARWQPLDDAIRAAADRGVKIRFLCDHRVKEIERYYLALDRLRNLDNIEVRLIKVPVCGYADIPYSRMLHAKMCVFDDKFVWVGSSNWTPEDFLRSRNVGIITDERGVVRTAEKIFGNWWASKYTSPF